MKAPTIVDALQIWGFWHLDISPLGETGDFALDLRLADAFRALIYRHSLKDRLDWLCREVQRPRKRVGDDDYHAELISWWLDIYEAEKAPIIETRSQQRRTLCVTS